MSTLLAFTSCPSGKVHSVMAAEALKTQGRLMGHEILIAGLDDQGHPLEADDKLARAEAIIVATDGKFDRSALVGRAFHATSTATAIQDPAGVIHAALNAVGAIEPSAAVSSSSAPTNGDLRKIVAVTACPTGIAHTFMAAEALRNEAERRGYEIAVETQGSVGAKNQLTEEQIAAADVVIIAADTAVDPSRFAGKSIYTTETGVALKSAGTVIDAAFDLAKEGGGTTPKTSYVEEVQQAKAQRSEQRSGPYKHLLTGVSYMLPIVVAGGLLIALSFVWGIEAFKEPGTLPAALMDIGGGAAFALMVPVLAGFIAYSIADRPGLAPGLVGGMLASQMGAGFLGGIVAGFIAGYSAKLVRDYINLPEKMEGLKPVLVIPLLATLVTGLMMQYVIGAPVTSIMTSLTEWLKGMSSTNAVILGLILGSMMAFDMGGPVNKAAYTFGVGLLGSESYAPMAAVMAAGMTPPLGLALATYLAPKKFNNDEHEASKAAAVLGICFITEGAIPFAAKDPLRVIPSIMAGSALTGALSMYFSCTLHAPHGGVFVLGIPNAVGNLGMYVVAIVVGTLATAAILSVAKKKVQ